MPKNDMKFFNKRITALILLLSIILHICGCQKNADNPSTNPTETITSLGTIPEMTEAIVVPTREYTDDELKKQAAFDEYLNDFFCRTISEADTISIHYLMLQPENFGITSYPITFGTLMHDEAAYEKELREELQTLLSHDKNAMNTEQQIAYDVLHYYLDSAVEMLPYYYYDEPLSTSSGIHAMLPVYFAEYDIVREQDIKDYLALMEQIKPYFEEIIAFEKKRIELGIFMSDSALDEIISQCRNICNDALDKFYLNDIFAQNISDIPDLSEEKKGEYQKEHERLVLEAFVPAYEYMILELSLLKGKGGKVNGASTYPDGEKYAEILCKHKVNSVRSLAELKSALEAENVKLMSQIQTLITLNPNLYQEMTEFSQPTSDPEKILSHLTDYFRDLFPGLNDCTYRILYVHQSLEDSVSPAFYMIPPLDGYKENSIYINRGSIENNGLFTTLAHEGYPGHLLQNTFFRSTSKYPIRALLSFLSYSEGWATYVEHSSYAAIDGVSGSLAKLLAANAEFSLNSLALADLGVNYEGWTYEQTMDYFSNSFGIKDEAQVKMFYQMFTSNPFCYLPYAIGALELGELINKQKDALGDSFDYMRFHQAFLTIGPAPMSIVEEYLSKQ